MHYNLNSITLLIVSFLSINTFAQESAKPTVGKINKKFTTSKINDLEISFDMLKEIPEGMSQITFNTPDSLLDFWSNRFTTEGIRLEIADHLVIPYDTAYISFNNEMVTLKRDVYKGVVPTTIIKNKYVSNHEWNLFQQYVLDSTLRKLFSEEGYNEFMIPTYYENGDKKDESEWNINWDLNLQKYYKQHPYAIYFGSELYYPPHERFNYLKQHDPRKLIYRYNISSQYQDIGSIYESHTFADSLQWISLENYHSGCIEEQLSWYYHHDPYFSNYPACNLVESQILGYLDWKETFHQQYLDKTGTDVIVKYSLPSVREVSSLAIPTDEDLVIIPAFDMSRWKISNTDYQQFVNYVRDSIAMRILMDEIGAEIYGKIVFDDEGQEVDESEWLINWNHKLDWSNLSEREKNTLDPFYYPDIDASNEKRIDARKLNYAYYPLDIGHIAEGRQFRDTIPTSDYNIEYAQKGIDTIISYPGGPHKVIDSWGYSPQFMVWNSYYDGKLASIIYDEDRSTHIHVLRQPIYPTMDCDYLDELKQLDEHGNWKITIDENGNYLTNYEAMYNYDSIPEPYDFNTEPTASVKINYTQAKAYYYWKRTLFGHVVHDENVIIANYVPSEEEWLKIQNEEQIIKPESRIKLPGPGFRYVIEYYPREIIEGQKITFVDYLMGGDQKLYRQGSKYALFDYYNKQLSDFIYDEIKYDSNDDLYMVKIGDKYGKMNYLGKELIPVMYDEIIMEKYHQYKVRKGDEWSTYEVKL
ncbi:MAG: hypothetical protein R2780_07120 [Crocinitomicaceae bacterium]